MVGRHTLLIVLLLGFVAAATAHGATDHAPGEHTQQRNVTTDTVHPSENPAVNQWAITLSGAIILLSAILFRLLHRVAEHV